jgi:hypothetical protein
LRRLPQLDLGDQRVQLLLPSRCHYDLSALFGEKLGGGPADAAAGTGDECNLVAHL